ncbi:hypothetical protein GGR48_000962 [Sphingomonas pseudosanguinis]|uniref:Uncharacterized protein n=1 Tax=Sphingomonas pseudosanguinis TaxID=413712 RepID=A0A7W6F229_9SPHN|nr:hypothetical protein [Sphingomonas pseudosanguinis]
MKTIEPQQSHPDPRDAVSLPPTSSSTGGQVGDVEDRA